MGEVNGLTRARSSLELLSYTAAMESEIEVKEGSTDPARISPSMAFENVSKADQGSRKTASDDANNGYSIEGYPSSDCLLSEKDDAASLTYLPVGRRSAFVGATNGTLPASMSTGSLASRTLKQVSPTPIRAGESSIEFQTLTGNESMSRRTTSPTVSNKNLSGLGSTGTHGSGIFTSISSAQLKSEGKANEGMGPSGATTVWPSAVIGPSRSTSFDHESSLATLEEENAELRKRLGLKDERIASLQVQVVRLEKTINDLRQLPTGKISQIPLEDMMEIMNIYGSEVSESSIPPRKESVQKASVVRQFRRWNPNFFEFFIHKDGKWIPKLGKEGELKRREIARKNARKKKPASSSSRRRTA